eukprot:jgi/Botrbrau1/5357/Bobra.0346s0028.1
MYSLQIPAACSLSGLEVYFQCSLSRCILVRFLLLKVNFCCIAAAYSVSLQHSRPCILLVRIRGDRCIRCVVYQHVVNIIANSITIFP